MNNNVVLKAVGLQKSYKEGGRLLHVLKDVNLEVHEGESVAIVGTSGSGKTTLLQCIGGLDRFDKGLIEIGGENIAELSEQRLTELRNRRLGFVYQFHHLLPEFTAMENVAMPLKIRREKASVAQKRAESLLNAMGLADRADHLPSQLSGGEQQRVCVARALINNPKLILADEPTGNLDEKNEKIVLDLFRQLHDQGTTVIVVTHDALVASCAQREIMLNHGVLVGEKWNDKNAHDAYVAAGGKPASTGSDAEGAQHGDSSIDFIDPTKAAKTGGDHE